MMVAAGSGCDSRLYQLIDSGTRLSVDERSCAFVLMAKAPRVGAVKTRLAPLAERRGGGRAQPELHPRHVGQYCRAESAHDRTSVSSRLLRPAMKPLSPELLPNNFTLLAQRGADLGERLLHVAEDLLAAASARSA